MLSTLFPTLLAAYVAIGLSSADELIKSYDRTGADPAVRAGYENIEPRHRVAAVVVFGALWPITWAVVIVSSVVSTVSLARSRRGL